MSYPKYWLLRELKTVTTVWVVFSFLFIVSVLSEGFIIKVYATLSWDHYHDNLFKNETNKHWDRNCYLIEKFKITTVIQKP